MGKNIYTVRGIPIEFISHDDLLLAYRELAAELVEERARHKADLKDVDSMLAAAVNGEIVEAQSRWK